MNILKLTVDNPEELLNASAFGAGALLRVEWCATQGGVYAEFATVPLVAGTYAHTVYHAAGTASTWYRSRYSTAAPAVAADYSDYSATFQAGGEEGGLICSIYDVKQRLGIAPADTADDEDLLEYIRAVTIDIETLTGRDFTGDPADRTVLVDTCSGTTLQVPQGIQSVTTLQVATTDQPDTGGTYTALVAGAWVLRPGTFSRSPGWPATAITRIDGGWFSDAINGAEITGRLGWAAVPANIARVGANAVVRAWRARSSGGADLAIAGPDGGMRMLRYMAPEDRQLLELYTVPMVK